MTRDILILVSDLDQHRNASVDEMATALPSMLQQQMRSLRFLDDQLRFLLGKLLLRYGLQELGHPTMLELQYSQHKRPSLSIPGLDFNITHSHSIIACAIAIDRRVGIDVEKIRDVSIENYEKCFTADEFRAICNDQNPCRRFFHQWTRKEALLKGIGDGFYLDPNMIDASSNVVVYQNRSWYIQDIPFFTNYVFHLATNSNVFKKDIKLQKVTFDSNA